MLFMECLFAFCLFKQHLFWQKTAELCLLARLWFILSCLVLDSHYFLILCSALLPNIFINPLEAPDNALIEADKPFLIPFFSWLIKSCHLLMVINYWYLADCNWCLCQGVSPVSVISSAHWLLPPFSFKLTPNSEEKQRVVGIFLVCSCEREDTRGHRVL